MPARLEVHHAGDLGVGLLHGDDFLDVINVLGEFLQFAEHRRLLGPTCSVSALREARQRLRPGSGG